MDTATTPRKPIDFNEVVWLVFTALISFSTWVLCTWLIPANPFGSLASDLHLPEIAAALSFYFVGRSRSPVMALACLLVFPTIQNALVYSHADSLNWMLDIL